MRRRDYLAVAVTGALAGCARTEAQGDATEPASTTHPSSPGCTADPADLPVPPGALRTALPRDHIPAIVDPAFGEDWRDLDVPEASPSDGDAQTLPDGAPVVGLEYDGGSRAYPLRVLNWHEVVNDVLPGGTGAGGRAADPTPVGVTYCPLCGSAVVFERRVAGRPAVFGVSGNLWCSNLVLYDRPTDSLWSQLHGVAIRGPRTGATLSVLPSSLTTWAEWRRTHPRTVVLLPPPRSNTVTGRDATFDYFAAKYPDPDDQVVGWGGESDGLHPRTLVIGVLADGAARAYPFGTVKRRDVIHDLVGGRPVVVASAPGGTMVAYDRRVAGTVRHFEPADDRHLRSAGSRWVRTTGRAVDGPHDGRRLRTASASPPVFWEAWSSFHPDTDVYGRE